jgi:hypothetical protein
MRGYIKYGVPLAGGLATAGYAASQGEDPGSAVLAGLAGGAGAAGGLLAARKLAGKYAQPLREAAQTHLTGTEESPAGLGQLFSAARSRIPADRKEGLRSKLLEGTALKTADVLTNVTDPRGLGKAMAAGLVPAGALTAGLGGIAAGAIPGAMGVPGFQQNVITDPELVGSSNTQMARMSTPTLRYIG